jgi:hypothetical protein
MVQVLKYAGAILCCVIFFFSQAWAIDYSTLSNDEMYELKGAVENAPETEQGKYQQEWQLRVSKMTQDEVKRYTPDTVTGDGIDDNTGEKIKAPFVQGRGYDSQGTGTVIFGGVPPGK